MDTDSKSRPVRAASGRIGHETTDASVGWIFGSVIILAAGLVLVHLVVDRMTRTSKASNIVAPPTVGFALATNFPRLQVAPAADLVTFRAWEEKELNGYGWVNRTGGIARIPVSLAMDLELKRGFPVRKPGMVAKTGLSEAELIQQSRITTNQQPTEPK